MDPPETSDLPSYSSPNTDPAEFASTIQLRTVQCSGALASHTGIPKGSRLLPTRRFDTVLIETAIVPGKT